ncbi:hypothetical protein XELAEV_18023848mg [Xenopus laevis]|uniref:Dedicator of cytokinesis 3 n=1 Tax=Xenopus laevis TaxID=8355 RepID=A0A974D7N3_XENLA|nr:hypothetical protein XELAEV_18023848mg [Xenopus laevis]
MGPKLEKHTGCPALVAEFPGDSSIIMEALTCIAYTGHLFLVTLYPTISATWLVHANEQYSIWCIFHLDNRGVCNGSSMGKGRVCRAPLQNNLQRGPVHSDPHPTTHFPPRPLSVPPLPTPCPNSTYSPPRLRQLPDLTIRYPAKHKVDLFYKLRHVMNEIIDLRRQLLSGHLTQDQVREVKRHLTVRLDWGNEHLGLDLVPRKEFVAVDSDQISVSDLYKMHLSSRHSVQQSTNQADTLRQRHKESRAPVPHHLLLNLKSFTHTNIGEDVDLFFSLYDMREARQISERFMVRLNKNGGPKNPEKLERLCALFTDLSSKDVKRDLHLVVHVIRIGRMLMNDSRKGPPHVHYRRPYGCAVLSLGEVLPVLCEHREEKDFVLKVYMCNNENEWYQIHENIIRKTSTKYSTPSSNYGLMVSLQLLRGDMEQIRRENQVLFNRGAAMTRKLGFPDVILPGDIRNDLYVTLERGDFERGGKSVQKNIEVTMHVLYADGENLRDCVSLGTGEPPRTQYHSFVLYHNNSPRWGELIKLPIPIDRFRGSHLRFEFRHCSTKDKGEKKLFGFSFTPLMRDDGTTLSDNIHELYVYKCDENSTFNNHALYLGLPCCKDDMSGCPNIPSSLIFQRSPKETFCISTQLSSTKLTQNVDLLALLKWKAYPDRILDILGRLRHVNGEEIVKFLQDILDTLFVILDENTEKYGLLVFQSLVFIINLLRDSKYYHFRPVLDSYIQKHFAGALAYSNSTSCLMVVSSLRICLRKGSCMLGSGPKWVKMQVLGSGRRSRELIRCLKWYMDRSADLVRQDHIQEAMRALEILFKFIVQSRLLFARSTAGLDEEQFRCSIHELFQSMRFVLSLDTRSSDTLLFTQPPASGGQVSGTGDSATQNNGGSAKPPADSYAALLSSFPAIFEELLPMFSVAEVAEFVRGTLSSLPSTLHLGQSMDVVKLQSIGRTVDCRLFSYPGKDYNEYEPLVLRNFPCTVDCRLFSYPEARRILLPVVLHHIHLHLRQQKELLVCSGILSSIFSIIKSSSTEVDVGEEVQMLQESLLDVLLQTLLIIMSKSQAQEATRGQRCPQCTAEITGEYVSCLLSLLRLMSDTHYQHLLHNFQSKEELKEFLLKIFCVFRNLLKLSVFPPDWTVMRLLASNVIVTTVQYVSPAVHKNFCDGDFDFKVWNSYFSLAVLFINQPSLQLENFAAAKRRRILDKYGDMRVMMTYELFNMWQNLGEHKYHFIPGMIGPFLGVSLVPQPEVRNIMIPIFHDMMDCEQRRNGNFKQVEAELIDKLDNLVSEGKGDENYRELFGLLFPVVACKVHGAASLVYRLLTVVFNLSLLEKIEQETWREPGASFVTSVTRLMERLLDYRDCMKSEEPENKKLGCTVNLMNFYKSEINKEEMFIRYIHKLCDLHLQAESYTGTKIVRLRISKSNDLAQILRSNNRRIIRSIERLNPSNRTIRRILIQRLKEYPSIKKSQAAFTLLLYWELLQWEERPLREFLHYPAQSEWQRKEGLSRKILHYFNKGKTQRSARLATSPNERIFPRYATKQHGYIGGNSSVRSYGRTIELRCAKGLRRVGRLEIQPSRSISWPDIDREDPSEAPIHRQISCQIGSNDRYRQLYLPCWEFGVPLCRELAAQYEKLYDYQSLSWILCSCPQADSSLPPLTPYVLSMLSLYYSHYIYTRGANQNWNPTLFVEATHKTINSEQFCKGNLLQTTSLNIHIKMEASYYDHIMDQQRLEPEFFRVGFYGKKFPFFLRNKEFVCRGHDYERLEAFQQRMLSEFPQAIAMQHLNHPDDTILQSDAQCILHYLQIYAVTPLPDAPHILQMDQVPERIKSFYRVNNVRRFRYDRPFHRGTRDKDNEFKSLWIERSTLTLSHSLPGISCWFEVQKRELSVILKPNFMAYDQVEVSPLENALQVLGNKTQELRALITQYQHHNLHGNINLLSMCLNGVIDAAVNGGITRYQEAFFDKEYITQHPEDAEKISQLKELMQEQVHVLGVGLAVHERCVHPEMRPLHKKLVDQFQVMRSSLYQEFPTLEKMNISCPPLSRSNILLAHGTMSADSVRLLHRHSVFCYRCLYVIAYYYRCLYVCKSHYRCLYVSTSYYRCLYVSTSHYRCLYVSTSYYRCLYVSTSHYRCLSVCLCITLHVSVCQCILLQVSVCQCIQIQESVCQCIPLQVSVCLYIPLQMSVCLYIPLQVSVCQCIILQMSVCQCILLQVSVCQYIPLQVSVCRPLVVLNSVRHSSSSLSSHASSDTGTTPTAGDSENEDPYSLQMLLPHSLHAGSITNVSALSSSYTSPSSSSLSSTHSAPSQLVNSAPSSTRGSPSLPDKYRHSRDLVMLLPAPRDRPSSAMYQTSTDNGQRCMYPRALFQQVLGPCKPCSDPNLSVAEKGDNLSHIVVLAAPSSWSLDSGTRESLPFMTSHIGSVLTPTGTTRGLTQGHYSLHFDAFHPAMGEGAPSLPTRSLRKSPLHTIPASPTSPQSCLNGSNSPLSGSASSGVSSLSEGNLSGCPDPATTTDPRTEEDHTGGFQHYPPVRYSLSDPNGLEPPKFQACRSHSAPSGVTPPRSPSGEHEEGGADLERTRRHRRNCTGEKEQPARVGWEHNISKQ